MWAKVYQPAPQTIDFTALPAETATETATLSATAPTSGDPVGYGSSTPSVCTVSGSTATFLTAGTCTLTASVAGDGTYAPSTTSQNVNVALAQQTITISSLGNLTVGEQATLSAVSNSNAPVAFSSGNPTVCTVSGDIVSFISVGPCIILASVPPNATYLTASIQQTFPVNIGATNVSFGSVDLCPPGQTTSAACSATQTVTFMGLTSPNLGTPRVLTGGSPNLDFTLSSTTCTGRVSTTTCTVSTKFTPRYPGLRSGAVQLLDSNGNVLATSFISGFGAGAWLASLPGNKTTFASGFTVPKSSSIAPAGASGIALDGAGDVFLTDLGAGVYKIPAGGGPLTTVFNNVSYPEALALDGAGNLFVTFALNPSVYKVPLAGCPAAGCTTVGTGFTSPAGLAVDGVGNLFVADYAAHKVYKVPAGAGAQTTVGAGFQGPAGLAEDGSGNLFVADSLTGNIYKVPANGSAQTTVGSGLTNPFGVSVNAAGDIYITSSAGLSVVAANGGSQSAVGIPGLNSSRYLAMDGAGDLFIANGSVVNEINLAAPSTIAPFPATEVNTPSFTVSGVFENIGTTTLAATGLTVSPNFAQVPGPGNPPDCTASASLVPGASCDLAFTLLPRVSGPVQGTVTLATNALNADPLNLSVSGSGLSSGSDTVTLGNLTQAYTGSPVSGATATASPYSIVTFAFTYSNGTYGPSPTPPTAPGIYTVTAAVSSVGVSGSATGTFVINNTSFGSVNVCQSTQTTSTPCSQTETLTFGIPTTTTLGTPNVLTAGAPYLDFELSSTTCTGSVIAGNDCTVTVTFSPLYPGVRPGAVQRVDTSGNILATSLISGTGQGSYINFGPGVQTAVSGAPSGTYGVAVDGAGNLSIVNTSANTVSKLPPNGGTLTTVGSGFSSPWGVAVDAAGNVFVTDSTSLYKIAAGSGTQTTLASGFFATGVAVDAEGDVFFTSERSSTQAGGALYEISAATGALSTVATGLAAPVGLALDQKGDAYIAAQSGVYVVPAGRSQPQLVDATFGGQPPQAVALNTTGDLFVANSVGSLFKLPALVGSALTQLPNQFTGPISGLAIDAAGDLFIAGGFTAGGGAYEVNYSQPPTLTFATTDLGSTSSDSPQTVSIQNIGNRPLSLSALTVGTNFVQVLGTAVPNNCSNLVGFSLGTDSSCGIGISFKPTADGQLQNAADLTTNAINGNPAVIALIGTGQQIPASFTLNSGSPQSATTFAAFANPLAVRVADSRNVAIPGVNVVFTAPAAGATGTFSNAKNTITVPTNASGIASAAFTANATVGGPYSVTAFTAGLPNVVFQLTNTAPQQTITFKAPPNQTYGAAPFNLSAQASSGLTVSFASLTSSTCTASGTTITLVQGGACTIQATQPGNTTIGPADPVTQTFQILPGTPVVTWATPAPISFGGSLGSTQLNATVSAPGTVTYSPAAGTVLPVGNGQTLTVNFTPTNAVDYAAASASVLINVTGSSTSPSANLVTTTSLARDPTTSDVVVTITIANTGGMAAANVELTSATIGSVSTATALPDVFGTVAASSQGSLVISFPAAAGTSGSPSVPAISGTYNGGSFTTSGRITLP